MTIKLLRNNERRQIPEDIEFVRGDDRDWTFTHDVDASEISEASFTARNSSGTAVIELTKDAHSSQWTVSTDEECTLHIASDDTEGLSAGIYDYDVEFVLVSGEVYTPRYGTLKLIADQTYDDETAAYLGRDTRSDYDTAVTAYEAFMADILAAVNASQLASDASSGAGSVTVDNAAVFSASDTIIVVLDSGAYDEHDIASIATNTLTLDGTTLSGNAGTDNVVQRVG